MALRFESNSLAISLRIFVKCGLMTLETVWLSSLNLICPSIRNGGAR
jgi:hypothetical protein